MPSLQFSQLMEANEKQELVLVLHEFLTHRLNYSVYLCDYQILNILSVMMGRGRLRKRNATHLSVLHLSV